MFPRGAKKKRTAYEQTGRNDGRTDNLLQFCRLQSANILFLSAEFVASQLGLLQCCLLQELKRTEKDSEKLPYHLIPLSKLQIDLQKRKYCLVAVKITFFRI